MPNYKSIDHYIASFPLNTRPILETLRKIIKEEIPDAEESISYNMPAIGTPGKRIVYFSGWSKHTSLYPFSEDMERAIQGAKNYKTSGKGTIQFPLDKPLPIPLIRKITQYLVKQNKSDNNK